ncbi:MAG TPA: F-box protein [Rhabdochlamydiaceae bacterium]|nr:F-box protein [Rhabdochlamydiaceae bacterium]
MSLVTNASKINPLEHIAHSDNKLSINDYAPRELVKNIFTYLLPEDLVRASRVCKKWYNATSESSFDSSLRKVSMLTKLFPSITVMDGPFWEEHFDLEALGLSVKDEPVFNKNKEIPFAKKLLAGTKVEGEAGITRLTIPKGHTFNKLETLGESPKEGNATKFRLIWQGVRRELGDKEAAETRIIYITNNILEGTREEDIGKQQELVEKQGYELPDVLTAATLPILKHVTSKKQPPPCLFEESYTRTSNEIDGRRMFVGGFGSAGLHVYPNIFRDVYVGAGGSAEVPRT